jgi:putative transcriptional regulator
MKKDCVFNCVQKNRRDKGVTQEDMAKDLGITRQTIIAIEKGNYTPSVLLAIKISKYFKSSVENIFSLTDNK